MKRLLKYMLRWQLSTFTLAPVIWLLADWNSWAVASIANVIGSLIFFKVDERIFNRK